MNEHRLTRRGFALAAGGAAALLAAPAVRAQARPERPRVQIAVDGRASLAHLPLAIAEALGYFQAEGLDVEITDVPSAARALQLLAAGGADVVGIAYEHTIHQQVRNQPIASLVLEGRAPKVALGVSTRAVPNYRSPADLRGRRIGVSAPGSSASMVASLVLARAGLQAADVSFVGVGAPSAALSAMRLGQIDAMSHTDPVMTMLELRSEVKIIGDTRTLKGTQDLFGGPMPAACLAVPAEFMQKAPVTCQALAHAIVHGLKWLQTAGPSDILRTVPEAYLLGDRALYLASFNKVREAISLDGLLPDEGARTALRVLATMDPGLRTGRVELARTYSNDFARRAKDRFKA